MFKKAGWTIVKPPVPLIPDGEHRKPIFTKYSALLFFSVFIFEILKT